MAKSSVIPLPMRGMNESANLSAMDPRQAVLLQNVRLAGDLEREGIERRLGFQLTADGAGANFGTRGVHSMFMVTHGLATNADDRQLIVVCGEETAGTAGRIRIARARDGTSQRDYGSSTSFPVKVTTGDSLGTDIYLTDGADMLRIQMNTAAIGSWSAPSSWAAAVTAGTLPANQDLMCTFLARVVLARSGYSTWYMSRKGNGLDYDFGASPEETSAQAFNTGDAGQPGEPIVGVGAAGDDYCIFGCERSMWYMAGDPAVGGRFYQMSGISAGLVGKRSFCVDPHGNFWFLGTDGELYVVPRGSIDPQNISKGRMVRSLKGASIRAIGRDNVMMAYDAEDDLVIVYLFDDAQAVAAQTVAVLYDRQRDAFMKDTYAHLSSTVRWPSAVVSRGGLGPAERHPMVATKGTGVGGRLSAQELFGEDVAYSDLFLSKDFEARAEFAPIAGELRHELMCDAVRFSGNVIPSSGTVATEAGAATWHWLVGDSPQEVVGLADSAAFETGTLSEGYCGETRVVARGNAHQLRITHDSADEADGETATFSLAAAEADIRVVSDRRRVGI